MKLEDLSKEALIQKIQELENQILVFQQEQQEAESLDFAWTGNLGHWYWDIPANKVTTNPLKITTLGYELTQIPQEIGFEFLQKNYIRMIMSR